MPVETFAWLADRVMTLPPTCGPVRLVAVDGPGGSGKTTFAGRLATVLGGCQVIHSDDFPVPWNDPEHWWHRLDEQVLQPLAQGLAGRFRRYDWGTNGFAEWIDVPVAPVLIIEGVGTARRAGSHLLTLAVWLEAPRRLRLERAIRRDGERYRRQWEQWMRAEDEFFALDDTRRRADLIVEGAPATSHDRDTAFVTQEPG